jgi:hypothetical protein
LTILIGNVLDAFGDNDPAKILLKIKIHLLTHIVEDVIRFGPAIRNSTEIFECFNAIFRLCSILSNHQAPSRDIARKFASMDRLKHILSGGFWKQDNAWVQAASNVREVLQTMPINQRHLGWTPPQKIIVGMFPLHNTVTCSEFVFRRPGTMHFASKQKSPPIQWKETQSASSSNAPASCHSVHWRCALSVTSQSGDVCSEGSWVFARNSKVQCRLSLLHVTRTCAENIPLKNEPLVGRVLEILMQDSNAQVPAGIVTLEHFLVSEELHPEFDMPVLCRPSDASRRAVTVLSDVRNVGNTVYLS